MKAIGVFPKEREIRIVDHPEPELKSPTDVELRMLEVGICGTDKEIAEFLDGTPPRGWDYFVLGHESLGEVASVGNEVTGLEAGDLAVMMVRRPCPHESCLACRAGRQDFCYTGDFTERGIKEAHGFMTERVVDDQRYVVRVPRELRDVAVLMEPLTIAEKALIQVWDIQERLPWAGREARNAGRAPRPRGLVLGAGPIGLLGAMTLIRAGLEMTIFSREPARHPKAEISRTIGANYISAEDVPASKLVAAIGRPVDLVYEASGASTIAFQVLGTLGANAIFVFTGVPGRKEKIEVDTSEIMRRLVLQNQVVIGTVNAGRDAFEAAVRDLGAFVRDWPTAIRSLITGRYPMEEHADLLSGKRGGIKDVITISH